MKKPLACFGISFFLVCSQITAQSASDSLIPYGNTYITLSPVVVDSRINVPSFIQRIKEDTSFYKAFKNLRVIGYRAIHDVRMLDKKENVQAKYHAKTEQYIKHGCRFMHTDEEEIIGNYFDEHHNPNYYTAQMYASLFFTKDSVCGETNVVGNKQFSTSGKSGLEKHKEQLKMLFFNPGKRINGLPFISNKTSIFDEDMTSCYDMQLDWDTYKGKSCLILKQEVKKGKEDDVVIDEMTTWFDDSTYEVLARNYSLRYNAGIYDFDVQMEVQMTKFNGLIVPQLIRYRGNWKVMFKRRERSVFTATLSDYKKADE